MIIKVYNFLFIYLLAFVLCVISQTGYADIEKKIQHAFLAPISECTSIVNVIDEMDKLKLDQMIESANLEKKISIIKALDNKIVENGGLKYSSPQERYVYFKLFQSKTVIEKTLSDINGISENSKAQLFELTKKSPDIEDDIYNFSRVAVSIFFGMIEDDTYVDFCEYLQNHNQRYLLGAPNVVLVDCERKEGYPGEGLIRITSFLELFGFQVKIVTSKDVENFKIPNLPFYPHIIGKRFLTATLQDDINKANLFHEKFPNSLLIAGGHEITGSDRIFNLMSNIYAATMGWGEFALTDILTNITVQGEKIVTTPDINKLKKIGSLRTNQGTFKRITPIENKDFRVLFQGFNPERIISSREPSDKVFIHSSSHCTEKCTFCMAKEAFTSGIESFQKVLSVTPKDIVRRLQRLEKHLPNLQDVEFSDDNFLAVRSRTQEFFALVKKHGFNERLKLHFETRLNNLNRANEEDLREMAALNVRSLTIGLESPLLKIVKSLKKGKSIYPLMTNFISILRKAKKAGIPKVYCFIILFTEEETMDDSLSIMRTLVDLICEEGIIPTIAESLAVFTGTELFKRYKSGDLKAMTLTVKNESFETKKSITIPSVVLPQDPDNMRYIKAIQSNFNLNQLQYLIRDEYRIIQDKIIEEVKDMERQLFLKEALLKLERIHLHLLAIERLYLTRKSQASKQIQELRFKRDEWIVKVLEEDYDVPFPSHSMHPSLEEVVHYSFAA